MRKFLKILFLLGLVFSLTACFNGDEESNGNDNYNEEYNENEEEDGRSINDFQDVPGVEPLIDRFPGSIRSHCVEGVFCIYAAEATVEEVLEFYENIATERGNPFNHEVVPEDHPHWVNTSADVNNPNIDEFSFTLGESPSTCPNCVEWVLYSNEWPN